MNFWEFVLANRTEIGVRMLEHMVLVGVSTSVAAGLGVPLGILMSRRSVLRKPILGVANVLQAIPSLALFGILIPLPLIGGIGASTAIVALVVYALLPIVKNTYTGIVSVDAGVLEAARGVGMTDGQLLRMVELPLAVPIVLAGVRVATVIGVGVATIAAAIGAGGLGVFIFRGVATVNNTVILAGAIPAALLALLIDGLLHLIERRLDWRDERNT